jgi:hypothetical protein
MSGRFSRTVIFRDWPSADDPAGCPNRQTLTCQPDGTIASTRALSFISVAGLALIAVEPTLAGVQVDLAPETE